MRVCQSGNSSRRIRLDQRRCNVSGHCLNSNVSAIILILTLIGVEYTSLQSVRDVYLSWGTPLVDVDVHTNIPQTNIAKIVCDTVDNEKGS